MTYVIDLLPDDVFTARYRGLRLVPSLSASREITKHEIPLWECKRILEEGYSAPRKRGVTCEERWLPYKKKIRNVVIVRSYDSDALEEIWLITHVGCFGRNKK